MRNIYQFKSFNLVNFLQNIVIVFLFTIILNLTDMDSTMDSDTNFNYYHEYCRAYLSNIVLLSQMR